MSTTEINLLRRTGKTDEALQEALKLYQTNPRDIWNARTLAWVYVEKLKQHSQYQQRDMFLTTIQKIIDLNLPEQESMLYDNIAWHVRRIMADTASQINVDYTFLDTLLQYMKRTPFTTTSDAFHSLMSAALKNKGWRGFIDFCQWWDLNNLRAEDYQQQQYEGKTWMGIAEQVYNAYCKIMEQQDNNSVVRAFISQLKEWIIEHPDYRYLSYYYAKLLYKLGDNTEAIEYLKPFARKNDTAFWVWCLLGDMHEQVADKMMFYCKAIMCPAPDDMLVRAREKVGLFFIVNGKYEMGKYLIEKVVATRKKFEKNPSYQLQSIMRESWYSSVTARWDNSFAQEQVELAEEFLFGQYACIPVMATFINKEKHVVNFVTENKQSGFFILPKKQKHSIQIGDELILKTTTIPNNGATKVRSFEKKDGYTNAIFYKTFSGILRKRPSGIGFVDKVFVAANKASDLMNEDYVKGTAMLSYDNKKQAWGWNALTIQCL